MHHHEISEHWGKRDLKIWGGREKREKHKHRIQRMGNQIWLCVVQRTTLGARRQPSNTFKIPRKSDFRPRILHPAGLSMNYEGKHRHFLTCKISKCFLHASLLKKLLEAVFLETRRHGTPQREVWPRGEMEGILRVRVIGESRGDSRVLDAEGNHSDHKETWRELSPATIHTNFKPRMKWPESLAQVFFFFCTYLIWPHVDEVPAHFCMPHRLAVL